MRQWTYRGWSGRRSGAMRRKRARQRSLEEAGQTPTQRDERWIKSMQQRHAQEHPEMWSPGYGRND